MSRNNWYLTVKQGKVAVPERSLFVLWEWEIIWYAILVEYFTQGELDNLTMMINGCGEWANVISCSAVEF